MRDRLGGFMNKSDMDNGWKEWKIYVLRCLDESKENDKAMEKKLDEMKNEILKAISCNRVKIARLEVKSSALGVVGGVVGGFLAKLIRYDF